LLTILVIENDAARAQTWTLTSAPNVPWSAIAMSADGRVIAACSKFSKLIYTSTDWGASWASNTAPSGYVESVAVSPDGTTMAAGGLLSYVYFSTNSGATWATNFLVYDTFQLLFSGDGTRLFSVGQYMYVTTNLGSSWTQLAKAGYPIACSADGRQLIADGGEVVDRSTNGGASWFPSFPFPDNDFRCVTSSGDGTRLSACYGGGHIYVSTNSGATWGQSALSYGPWSDVCSMDAKRLIAWGTGFICNSTDFGRTWTTNGLFDVGLAGLLACSQDGIRLVAADGLIYTAFWPPVLNVQSSASNIVLSWSAPATGWSLQQNSDITTTNWTNIPVSATTTNFENQVILAPSSNSAFFRLAYSPP
jgi:photosystem II stability/assembly factor-like uncharacterized protein